MNKDIHFYDEDGDLKFTVHSAYIFTAVKNGTRMRRTLTNFNGPAPIAGFLPKGVVHENEIVQKYCQMIKDGEFNLPEDVPQSPTIMKDLVVDMNFEVVTDLATTWKYNINRKQMLEMFNGAEDGKGVVKDSNSNSWTFEKTAADGSKSHIYFKNEVLVENKQMEKDLHFYDA